MVLIAIVGAGYLAWQRVEQKPPLVTRAPAEQLLDDYFPLWSKRSL